MREDRGSGCLPDMDAGAAIAPGMTALVRAGKQRGIFGTLERALWADVAAAPRASRND